MATDEFFANGEIIDVKDGDTAVLKLSMGIGVPELDPDDKAKVAGGNLARLLLLDTLPDVYPEDDQGLILNKAKRGEEHRSPARHDPDKTRTNSPFPQCRPIALGRALLPRFVGFSENLLFKLRE